MLLPGLLYGSYPDVRKRCRTAIRRCITEQRLLWEVVQADGMLDTAQHPGLIVVEPLLGGSGNNFHCYAPLYLMQKDDAKSQLSAEAAAAIFSVGLEEQWSLTCMLSRQVIYSWMGDTEHYRRYVLAFLRQWGALDAEGERYSSGMDTGRRLWELPTMLQSALVNLGVPIPLVQEPLPPGGLYALLGAADRTLAGDLVDIRQAHTSPPTGAVQMDPPTPVRAVSAPPEGTFMSEQMSRAVEADDPTTVRRLIEAGEPVSAIHESWPISPLLWAAQQGHTDLARFLLDRGAPIEDQADEGESPLMLAAKGGHRDTVQLLLERGADPYYVTHKNFDVRRFARWSGNADIIAVLDELWSGRDPDDDRAEREDY